MSSIVASITNSSTNRFKIKTVYNKQLIELFKTMPKFYFDPATKEWSFNNDLFEELISKMATLSIQCNDERIPPSSFQNQDQQFKKKAKIIKLDYKSICFEANFQLKPKLQKEAVISKTGEMLFPSYFTIPIITNCLDVDVTPEYKNFTESETQFFYQYDPVGLGYKY